MKRMFLVLAVAALMAAMMVASAMPAFADATPPNASCIGVITSASAPVLLNDQTVGENLSGFARDGGLGQFFNEENRGGNYGEVSPNC